MGVGNGFYYCRPDRLYLDGIWLFIYKPIAENPKVNDAERAYIQQDDTELTPDEIEPENESKLFLSLNVWALNRLGRLLLVSL